MNPWDKPKEQLLYELHSTVQELNAVKEAYSRSLLEWEQKEKGFLKLEEDLKYAVELNIDGIYAWDVSKNHRVYSTQWNAQLGYQESEIGNTLEDWLELLHLEERNEVMSFLNNLFSEQKDSYKIEHRILHQDGSYKWVLDRGKIILRDESGKPLKLAGTVKDITVRKQAENAIQDLNKNLELKIIERTAQLAAINENLQKEIEERKHVEEALRDKTNELEKFFTVALNLLCIADLCGNFITVNKAWEKVLGYTTEELEQRNFLDFVHPEDIPKTIAAMSKLSSQEPVYDFVNRYRSKDGSYRFVEWRSVPVGDKIYAAAHDITERKRAEAFENELLHFSPQLASISHNEVDGALNTALQSMGNFLAADRAYIFLFNENQNTMSNTHEWCNEGIQAEIENLQDVPNELFPMWMKTLNQHNNVVIQSVEDLSEAWQGERDILEPQGVQSLIAIPLFIGTKLIGFVGLDSVLQKREYKASEINIITVWGSMLASLINKQKVGTLLEQTRKNYQGFFNTIEDFVFVCDQDGNIITTNNAVSERLGFTKEELTNTSVMNLHPGGRREEAKQILNEILAGTAEFCSIPLVTKAGKQVPVETRVKRGTWNGKNVVLGVSKDITPIKLSEEKFSSAFQANAAMMSISYFETGNYIDVNNAFVETLGFSYSEIIGNNNKEIGIYVEHNICEEIVLKLKKDIPVRKQEVQLRTKEGIFKTGLLSADSIFIGEDRCLLTVIVDITDRKKAEEEISKARHEAEEASLAKNEFLSRMSHELRTPMNAILGFAQLLEMGELNQGQKKGVGHILRSGKHLLNLINEVLDLSRIEAGRLSLSLEAVKIAGVITESLDIMQPLAHARQIHLSQACLETEQLYLQTDRQMLKQVLLNLLSNAVKYNHEGGTVVVKSEVLPSITEGVGFVRISVTDTGLGIPENEIPKLFKPFERIGAEKTGTEGTGLGLAVTKKLVCAMGGKLGVNSRPGTGSTFWIELPQSGAHPVCKEDTTSTCEQEATIAHTTATILYIEDSVSNIELVEQILLNHRMDTRLVTATHGSQTVQLAIEFQPDIILLDLDLPDINGRQVLRLLQNNDKTCGIPVIIVSADAMPQQINTLLKEGAKRYLTKPLEIKDFLHVINDCLAVYS